MTFFPGEVEREDRSLDLALPVNSFARFEFYVQRLP